MNNKKKLLIIILIFALLLGGAFVLYTELGQGYAPDQLSVQQTESTTGPEATPSKLNQAPDFTVYDLQSNEIHLSDYFGKPIVLNFWASWCAPCRSEMPHFEEKYLELKDDVTFLMVNMTDHSKETVNSASQFIEEKGYTFPVLYDAVSSAALAYRVYSLPTTFFIDAQGNAVAQATGAIDAETLQRGIDMIVK